ncbi:uncharacterized protein LOC129926727 isoform X2 [Biomphalaria glabrata]|nr:uncharacterized protein LOC129926727 isoform X2 [Biomphalaria glabrata]XP_055888464.1 uncharacterized protein LOC129926727 isoform X2 [Biomphalaria glabrata]XP_055888465.1 uncharacterized protein LOC129926727 isoform X2 [Biomphalaria glabrata]
MPTYVQLILLKMRNIIFILSLLIIQVLRYTPHFRSLSLWVEYFFWLVTGFKFHPKCHAKLSQAINTMGLIMNRQRESPMATSELVLILTLLVTPALV